MIWVSWRQQRTEAILAVAILALLAALLVPTGLQMASAYSHDGLSACTDPSVSPACDQSVQAFLMRFQKVGDLIAWFTLVPGLIGVLLAAPVLLQLEQRTFRLDWTQSITRGRWIAGKLGLAVAAALVASLAFIALITWWRTPFVHIQGRMENSVYDSEGTVVVGYTLFALGLAAAIGAVWRRAVPALLVGFIGYFVTRVFVDTWLRQRLVDPLTIHWTGDGREPTALRHAWVLNQGVKIVQIGDPSRPVQASAVYHPASHFWPLQLIETALFGGLALALLAFAAWWIHERTA